MAWETKRSCIRPVRVDGETMPGFYNFYILPHACYFRPGGVYTVHVQKTSNHRQRQHDSSTTQFRWRLGESIRLASSSFFPCPCKCNYRMQGPWPSRKKCTYASAAKICSTAWFSPCSSVEKVDWDAWMWRAAVTAIAPYVRPSTPNSFYRLLGSSNLWGV